MADPKSTSEYVYVVLDGHVTSSNPNDKHGPYVRGERIDLAHLTPETRQMLVDRKVIGKPSAQDAKDAEAQYAALNPETKE